MMRKLSFAFAFFVSTQTICWADSIYDSLCPSNPEPSAVADARQWSLTLSPVTHHWAYNPEHRHVYLGSLEHYGTKDRFCGAALFRNSFGQPSAYVYFGKEWSNLLDSENWYAKVSGGLIYGYKGDYKDKIPFNDLGIAPAVIPSLGYKFSKQDSVQFILLGNSALMFAYGHDF
jgi:hypothetical protein